VRVANYLGLALIVVIFAYATYSDIHRFHKNMFKRTDKKLNIGGVKIGGGNPVAVQSMTTHRYP